MTSSSSFDRPSCLQPAQHAAVQALCLSFEKGDDDSKQVFIRDQLDIILKDVVIEWRLCPKEVGIHPSNRDQEGMTPAGVWLRGARILASGFSHHAIGKLWAFEDHPVKKHIAAHTIASTAHDARFAKFSPNDVKVGLGNWTHSNQFRVHGGGCHGVFVEGRG